MDYFFFLTKFSLNLKRRNYGNLLNTVLSLFEEGEILISSVSISCLLLAERCFEKVPSSLSSFVHIMGRERVFFRKVGIYSYHVNHLPETYSGMATEDGPS